MSSRFLEAGGSPKLDCIAKVVFSLVAEKRFHIHARGERLSGVQEYASGTNASAVIEANGKYSGLGRPPANLMIPSFPKYF